MPYKDKAKEKEWKKRYSKKHRIKIKKYQIEYRQKNKDRIKEKLKEYYYDPKNKLKRKKYNEKPEVKERRRIWHKKYRKKPESKEKMSKYKKVYYHKNKEEILRKRKEYHQIPENKKRKNKRDIEYKKKCYNQRPEINIKFKIRKRLYKALRDYTKTGKIMRTNRYGVNYKEIIEYLKPLPPNLQDYDLHHIKPLFTFNFINEDGSTNIEEVKKAFAPENHKLMLRIEHQQLNHFELSSSLPLLSNLRKG